MLAHGDELRADTERRIAALAADLAADDRVRFAFVSGVAEPSRLAPLTGLTVFVYLDPSRATAEARADIETCVSRRPGIGNIAMTVLNDVELEQAGRLLAHSEVLVDPHPDDRVEFEARASRAYEDFCCFETVCVRELAADPYGTIIDRKLALLDGYVARLRSLSGITVAEYETDWMMRCAIERTLELAVQTAISLARHVVADRRLRAPATYADTFAVAREAGLIDPPLAASMSRMCGFRNRLVHEGAHLDSAVVVGVLRRELDDLTGLCACVKRLGSVGRPDLETRPNGVDLTTGAGRQSLPE